MISYSHGSALGALLVGVALGSGCSPAGKKTASSDSSPVMEDGARLDEDAALDEELPGFGLTPANFEDEDETIESVNNDQRTRENGNPSGKIVGGTLVPANEFPDIVGIAAAGSTVLRCTGTLIEQDIVLTAGHCSCAGIDKRVFIGNKVGQGGIFYKVKASKHGLRTEADGKTCVYPKNLKDDRDLAVLLLTQPVAKVSWRTLAPNTLVNSATSYQIVGFGATDRDATKFPREKHEAEVFATTNDCTVDQSGRPDEPRYGCKPNEEIVAGAMRHSTDTCQGDSGGPLLVGPGGNAKAGTRSQYMLAGVTSRASSERESKCGDGGIYERMTEPARKWTGTQIAKLRAGQ